MRMENAPALPGGRVNRHAENEMKTKTLDE